LTCPARTPNIAGNGDWIDRADNLTLPNPEKNRRRRHGCDLRETRYVSAYQIALIYPGLGDSTHTLQWLNQAEQELDPWMVWVRQDPRFEPYRSLPEFAAIEQRAFTPR
jgi:hypothetical protein